VADGIEFVQDTFNYFFEASIAHATTATANAIIAISKKMSDIPSLEKQVHDLNRSIAGWNKLYVWALGIALLVGVFSFWAQRQAIIGSRKLVTTSSELSEEKDRQLQRDLANARLELARIDPVNLPIKSLKADVSIVARGKFFDWNFTPPRDPKTMCRVSISPIDGGGIATMLCDHFESFPMIMHQQDGPEIRDARTFSMSFAWPYADWSQAQWQELQKKVGIQDLLDRETISTARLDEMLDKKLAVLQILMMPSDGDVEILTQSFVLTINGSIQRKFSFPTRTKFGILNCTPEKD
jgi:hypothetical protein